METSDHSRVVCLGVYGTSSEIEELAERARALAVDVDLVRGPEVDERYEGLVEQWLIEHPGRRPSPDHGLAELRAAVVPGADPAGLKGALTRLICPEPEHNGPCPMPWAVA